MHIGYPKTGTTSIEKFLFRSSAELQEAGIGYPIPDLPPRFAHHNLAWELKGNRSSRDRRFRPDSITFSKLSELLGDADADVLMLSSDEFAQRCDPAAAAEAFQGVAADAGVAVEVVVFLRPQHSLLNSLYAQRVCNFNEGGRFRPYVRKALRRMGLLDYAAHLREWENRPGLRLVPKPFTRGALKPDLHTVFFEAVGLADRVEPLLQDAGRYEGVNRSLGPCAVEVFRRLSTHLSSRGGWRRFDRPTQVRLRRKILSVIDDMPPDGGSFNGLDDRLRLEIDERFAESNRALAERYWSADWSEIFEDDYRRRLTSNEFDPDGDDADRETAIAEAVRRAVDIVEATT